MNATARAWAASIAVLSVACGSSDALTEVLVVVDTDYAVPAELDRVRITVTAPDGQVQVAQGPVDLPGALPATLGVVHRGGALADVRVVAEGLLGATVVARREAVFAFIDGDVRALRLDLLRRCASQVCGAGMTCGEAGCRSERVRPEELTHYDEPLSRDAGPSDAGLDAAAVADGGPVCSDLPAQCGPRVDGAAACACRACACDVRCDPAECSVECRNGARCSAGASGAGVVEVLCRDAECAVDASGAADVTVTCARESDCEVDCTGAESCRVACRTSSRCLVRCASAGSCAMGGCSPASCPGGELVCGRGCP